MYLVTFIYVVKDQTGKIAAFAGKNLPQDNSFTTVSVRMSLVTPRSCVTHSGVIRCHFRVGVVTTRLHVGKNITQLRNGLETSLIALKCVEWTG